MKHTALLLVMLFLALGLQAQQLIPLGRTTDRVEVLNDQAESLQLHFNYSSLKANTMTNRSFTELTLDGGVMDGEVGCPKLPVTQRLIEIPFGAIPQARVLHKSVQEVDLTDYGIQKIMPMQAPVSKDDLPESMPFVVNDAVYQQDAYLGNDVVNIEVLGTLRGYHIAKLTVSPVKYNPVKNKLLVYNDIDLEISFPGADMALTHEVKAKTYSPYFDFIGQSLLNQGVSRDYPDHPDMTRYPIKYVIIADRMFDGYLGDFIEWKTRKGFHVVLAFTDEIGTTAAAIKDYIHGLYDNATAEDPAPSFVLFVGDTPQIPGETGYSTQTVTDLYYMSVDGDYFPEMYYGRFSAQRPEQLIPQIEKTLYYEQYQFVDPSYLNRATLIAGWDDYWTAQIGVPTVNYGLNYWFNEEHGYSDVYPYYGPSDYAGCYTDDKVSVSVINYTAHCSETVWGTPSLSSSTISKMHNEGCYPIAIGNCCLSGQYSYGECVGESWVRADKKGAVCYIGSSPNTYWYEDAWWAMGAYHITNGNLGQTPQQSQTSMGSYDAMHESGYISSGGLTFCGNLAVTEACNHGWSDAARYYWEAYNVLGDPSLVCYHTEGTNNTYSHDPVLFKGTNHFNVEADPQSFVALTKDGAILGTGLVGDSGELTLNIDPVVEGGFAELVITKPQRIPVMAYIPIATPGQPHLVVEEVGPSHFDYNQETAISVLVKNVGDSAIPAGTVVELQSLDERMEVLSAQSQLVEAIAVGATALVENAFVVKAGVEARNGERFRLIATADCGDMVCSDFYVTVDKPVFEFVDFDWSGSFYSGGTFNVEATFKNIGGAAAVSPVGLISSSIDGLSFPQGEEVMGRMEVGTTVTCHYVVSVPETVEESVTMELLVSLEDLGVRIDEPISMYNVCPLVLELRDAGGNGWEGASLKMIFQDDKPSARYELTDGSEAVYELPNRQGYKIKLSWIGGNNDSECGFTLRHASGDVVFEAESNMAGNLGVFTIDCSRDLMEIVEFEAQPMVRVFPNPATNMLNVASESPMQRCLLMNSLGQIVIYQSMVGNETQMSLEGIAPGIYLLRVSTADGDETQKVMIR